MIFICNPYNLEPEKFDWDRVNILGQVTLSEFIQKTGDQKISYRPCDFKALKNFLIVSGVRAGVNLVPAADFRPVKGDQIIVPVVNGAANLNNIGREFKRREVKSREIKRRLKLSPRFIVLEII